MYDSNQYGLLFYDNKCILVESKCGYNTDNKIINKHMGYYILSFVYIKTSWMEQS